METKKSIESIEEKKQRIKEYNANYYRENKEVIIGRLTEKVTCICGRTVGKNSLKSHMKTKIHEKHLKLKESEKELQSKLEN